MFPAEVYQTTLMLNSMPVNKRIRELNEPYASLDKVNMDTSRSDQAVDKRFQNRIGASLRVISQRKPRRRVMPVSYNGDWAVAGVVTQQSD